MLRNMRVARKLPLLVGAMSVALVVFALAAFAVLDQAKIGGDDYRQISLDKELLADVLPPPAYLVESMLVANQLSVSARNGDFDAAGEHAATLERLEADYRGRLEYWHEHLEDPSQREAMLERAEPAAERFFDVLHTQLLPALQAERGEVVAAAVDGPLRDAYEAHRSAVDDVVTSAVARAAEREQAVNDAVARSQLLLAGGLGVAVAVSVALARLITRSITAPLATLRAGLEAVADQGTVDGTELDADRGDELGAVAAAFNRFAAAMRERIAALDRRAEQLTAVAVGMERSAEEVCFGMETVASATTEMDATINEIARTAGDAARIAADAVHAVERSMQRMEDLQRSSARIADAVLTIGQITDKTHLLALNAHIEAEHAGDSGRGFAVVAHEVKELARRTGDTTNSIGSVVAGTGDDVASAVAAMEHIRTIIGDVEEASTVIAAAVEEQTAAMREIVGQVEMAAQRGVQIREAVRDARSVGAA